MITATNEATIATRASNAIAGNTTAWATSTSGRIHEIVSRPRTSTSCGSHPSGRPAHCRSSWRLPGEDGGATTSAATACRGAAGGGGDTSGVSVDAELSVGAASAAAA